MSLPLPDIFEARQAREILAAYQAGDFERAAKLEDHLITEGSTSAEERERLKDQLRCALLFRAQADASAAGDSAGAEMLSQVIKTVCSERSIKTTLVAAWIHAGMELGLPGHQYDQLTAFLDELGSGPEIRAAVAEIRRLD
ncbi:hypothetical protein [Streptomyces sp. NPDC020667]|uniref:hypothetical protein n=1 Tax=Streptomyces sp. NPDC020667 TaxID=3154895 RepID=UPI0033FAF840